MDTSDIYVKMSDCEEIQIQKLPQKERNPYATSTGVGDWWCNKKSGNVYVVQSPLLWEITLKDDIWIPRQDQIPDRDSVWFMHHRGEYIVEDKLEGKEPVRVPGVFGSMDQAWMAWYMFKKHRKMWDGGAWKA